MFVRPFASHSVGKFLSTGLAIFRAGVPPHMGQLDVTLAFAAAVSTPPTNKSDTKPTTRAWRRKTDSRNRLSMFFLPKDPFTFARWNTKRWTLRGGKVRRSGPGRPPVGV